MGVVKIIADFFRASPKTKEVDRYGILSPLLSTGDRVEATMKLFKIISSEDITTQLAFRNHPSNGPVEKAITAYRDYVKGLPGQEQTMEKKETFSTILETLDSIKGNLDQIEDNFQTLFGSIDGEDVDENIRASSLVVIGYLEKTDEFTTWLAALAEHLTSDVQESIPPFRTKELITKAAVMAEFSALNLHRWSHHSESLLNEVKEMQRRGSDLAVKSNGQYIDDFAHDNQFSDAQQELMKASLRSPIMIAITWGVVKTQEKIELYTARKDWLTAKILFEQEKLRGLDVESAEYHKLQKATQHYANLVSKYEQKIERMRA